MQTVTENETKNTKAKPIKRNQTWEKNHFMISKAIALLMRTHERMPSKEEIAEETGLDRSTIYNHLKEINDHVSYQESLQQFDTIASQVLAVIGAMALEGEIRAARLSLEIIGISKRSPADNLKRKKKA